ncbi:MAG TPA: NAD(P)H-dependent oxidoreductase subunit E [Candidatus Angelobacter sp.]|nr:NAD(P)H-dependent oxidoreductase subunit E [Candidatus Angelobacter sp.]
MDLHLTNARATTEERAAVDSELGAHDPSRNGNSPRPTRDRLLPVLHAVQKHIGWISAGAVNYVAERMNVAPAEVHGVASFYGMFSLEPRPPIVAHVCDDIACKLRGADEICAQLQQRFGPPGSASAAGNSQATWLRSQCLGLCEHAPAAMITVAGARPQERTLAPAKADKIELLIGFAAQDRLPRSLRDDNPKLSVPQSRSDVTELRLLARVGKANPASLADYRKLGGYEGLENALNLGAEGVIREVAASKLLGRGGAAFPTAKKWEALHLQRKLLETDRSRAHYIICNADESEPGTFKDRVLMEGDPFAIVEGMTIGALATGAGKGYIYLRGEYPLAAERMAGAIDECRKNGLLGANILGRGLAFDLEIRRGAGAYICGEETALFNSIEGYRGEPRNKPPFPTQAGVFRQPTAVNNVETLANVPLILREGGAAFAQSGTENSSGTRLFCLSGHVVQPGLYEAAMGITLRQLIDLAGGVAGNGRLQAVLLGGAAGTFVSPRELDTLLTFEGTRAIGATLGSGVIMLFDDSVDLRQILLRIAGFFRHETCGQCVPCRVGVVRQQEALERLAAGKPLGSRAEEIVRLREMGQAMRDASICGLGQTASSAVESALQRWSLFT